MKFCEKNVLCEKGDEITRFDGNRYQYRFRYRGNVLFSNIRVRLEKPNFYHWFRSLRSFTCTQIPVCTDVIKRNCDFISHAPLNNLTMNVFAYVKLFPSARSTTRRSWISTRKRSSSCWTGLPSAPSFSTHQTGQLPLFSLALVISPFLHRSVLFMVQRALVNEYLSWPSTDADSAGKFPPRWDLSDIVQRWAQSAIIRHTLLFSILSVTGCR